MVTTHVTHRAQFAKREREAKGMGRWDGKHQMEAKMGFSYLIVPLWGPNCHSKAPERQENPTIIYGSQKMEWE